MNRNNHTASLNLPRDIEKHRRPDSPPQFKFTRTGYESVIQGMYIMEKDDPLLDQKVFHASLMMELLSDHLKIGKDPWPFNIKPEPNSFTRITLSLDPNLGTEIVVGIWGKGWEIPIHGHSEGFMHEEILSGKIEYRLYEVVDHENKKVKLTKTFISESGVIGSQFYEADNKDNAFVHSFTVLEDTVSLHFLPGQPGDGHEKLYTLQ